MTVEPVDVQEVQEAVPEEVPDQAGVDQDQGEGLVFE